MSSPEPHRLFLHFRELPLSLRVAYTGTLLALSVGYIFSMVYIFTSHAGRDGDPMFSVDDLVIAYSGSKSDTRLEAALKGPMAGMLPQEDRAAVVAWVRSGAEQENYKTTVSAIFEQRCVSCHGGSKPCCYPGHQKATGIGGQSDLPEAKPTGRRERFRMEEFDDCGTRNAHRRLSGPARPLQPTRPLLTDPPSDRVSCPDPTPATRGCPGVDARTP